MSEEITNQKETQEENNRDPYVGKYMMNDKHEEVYYIKKKSLQENTYLVKVATSCSHIIQGIYMKFMSKQELETACSFIDPIKYNTFYNSVLETIQLEFEP